MPARFSLDELKYEYPDEPVPARQDPAIPSRGSDLGGRGLALSRRHPGHMCARRSRRSSCSSPSSTTRAISSPSTTSCSTRDDLGILCQGRGSAANSAVCYCLAITNVDPTEIDLLFERFVSPERKEPPDIDVDFEHERREEVIQYIYARYGRDRAGLAATVISYRGRSARARGRQGARALARIPSPRSPPPSGA